MAKDNQSNEQEQKPQINTVSTLKPSNNTVKYIAVGVAGLAVLVLVFFAGARAEQHHNRAVNRPITAGGFGFAGGGRRFGGGGRYFGGQQNGTVLSGNVTAINGNSFTLNENGSSKTINTDSNTRFAGVGIDGLKSGDNVRVAGTANSDGSIQALSVIIAQPNLSST